MKAGFIPALGTPLDKDGNLVLESYKKQIEDQINAGAVGILCMGSMGQQPYIRQEVCLDVAKAAVEAAAGRVPVYVGAMDCVLSTAQKNGLQRWRNWIFPVLCLPHRTTMHVQENR